MGGVVATRGQAARRAARAAPVELEDEVRSFGREAISICLGLAGALLVAAIVTYSPGTRENAFGPLGAVLADLLVQSLGLSSFLVPGALFAMAVAVYTGARPRLDGARLAAGVGALVSSAVLANLAIGKIDAWEGRDAGGIIGGLASAILEQGTGPTGAWVTALTAFLLLTAFASGQSLFGLARAGGRGTAGVFRKGQGRLRDWAVREPEDANVEPIVLGHEEVVPGRAGAVRPTERERRAAPVISRPKAVEPETTRARRQVEMPFADGTSYCLPDVSLLDPPIEGEVEIDHDALIASSRVLEAKLHTFNVKGTVQGIHPGPVITTYEFEPAAGIKVNRVTALADDLAMAMQAMSVRILAPIPGKSVVGIEVANPRRETVSLREIISSDAFQQSKSTLALALGKDTTGSPAAGDLARMPHLLVAGATGAGKSVFLNTLLLSILMRASPRDVQLVLVDPKMLELATYEEIPHLLVPVITEAKPAVAVLENLVKEMNERYKLMKEKGVRNIDTYNKVVAEGKKSGKVIELDEDEREEGGEDPIVHQHLPRIVVIIDELADLMMTRRDCEEPITRLAQKARAAGIHMVIATQRPSVDVITGLIKANFPSRISFQVAGKVDSRTILDTMGAERLLGMGDMLFLPPGTSQLQRLHGAYVSDDEIQKITDFVREQQKPRYRMELFEDDSVDDEGPAGERSEEQYDALYDDAVAIVTETGKASISYVQRRLQVGYNRAARMIECMEREGVVSSPDHRGNREILAPRGGYEE